MGSEDYEKVDRGSEAGEGNAEIFKKTLNIGRGKPAIKLYNHGSSGKIEISRCPKNDE